MLGLLVCLFFVASTVSAQDYGQEPMMWLLDSPMPVVERSQRSLGLGKPKERTLGQAGQGGHFPFYRGLGRK